MFKKSIVLLMSVAMIAILAYGVIGSGAWFSDSATSSANTITTGTLSIDDGQLSKATINVPNLAPGDVTGDIVFYITNNGNVNLAWLGDLSFTDPSGGLADVIYIDYAQMEFLGGSWAEPTDNFISNGRGSGDWPSAYNTTADLSEYHVITLENFVAGRNFMGVPPYEFAGALRPGYAYRLTLRLGMVKAAGNEYQHLGPMTLTLKVDATQVNLDAIQILSPNMDGSNMNFFNTQITNQH